MLFYTGPGDTWEAHTISLLASSIFPFIWWTILSLPGLWSWLSSIAYGIRRVISPTLPWLLPYSSNHQLPSISVPHFIFYLSCFSDFLYHLTLAYAVKAQLLYSPPTPALHVHWKQLHIEDNSTGTAFLPYGKATGGGIHLTGSLQHYEISSWFWLKRRFSRVRTRT